MAKSKGTMTKVTKAVSATAKAVKAVKTAAKPVAKALGVGKKKAAKKK